MRTWISLATASLVCLVASGAVLYTVAGAPSTRRAESPLLALDRPEVRAPTCPSAGAMVWKDGRFDMVIGAVTMYFAAVGPQRQVLTGHFADGLKQKIPLRIDAPPGTAFVVEGQNQATGAEMTWEGPSVLSDKVPVAERKFVPGSMSFPSAGCYQVFVTIEGERVGPFGFEVAEGS